MVVLENYFRKKKWKRAFSISLLIVTLSFLFSVAVFYFQRNTFADFTEVGKYIAGQNLKGGKVYAREIYNLGNYNLKLSFWAKQPINFWDPGGKTKLRTGDYLILSNVYNPFEQAYKELSARYEFEVVYQTEKYALLPLLPDIMVYPPGATSQPNCMAYRFLSQAYYSYILRITGETKR